MGYYIKGTPVDKEQARKIPGRHQIMWLVYDEFWEPPVECGYERVVIEILARLDSGPPVDYETFMAIDVPIVAQPVVSAKENPFYHRKGVV